MVAVPVDRRGIESSQTVDKTGLMNDLGSPPALSGFDGVRGFNDFWWIKERSGGTICGQREAIAFGWGCGLCRRESGGGGFTR